MKKKEYKVNDYASINECIDQMNKDGYSPIRRIEKPVFVEKNGERVPLKQEIVFIGVLKEN